MAPIPMTLFDYKKVTLQLQTLLTPIVLPLEI